MRCGAPWCAEAGRCGAVWCAVLCFALSSPLLRDSEQGTITITITIVITITINTTINMYIRFMYCCPARWCGTIRYDTIRCDAMRHHMMRYIMRHWDDGVAWQDVIPGATSYVTRFCRATRRARGYYIISRMNLVTIVVYIILYDYITGTVFNLLLGIYYIHARDAAWCDARYGARSRRRDIRPASRLNIHPVRNPSVFSDPTLR